MIKDTINALGLPFFDEDIDTLQNKISYVHGSGKYDRLIKEMYRDKDVNNFYSKVFEISIAYAIEMAGLKSLYEINVREDDSSSIDFKIVDESEFSLFIEAKLIQDIKTKNEIYMQLENNNYYSVHMDGDREKTEILRIQSDILSKLQKKDGARIKFVDPENMCANIVAIDVGDLILGCIDPYDCILACCGDSGVGKNHLKRGVVGVFEQPTLSNFFEDQELEQRFENTKTVLNGVIFLFRPRRSSRISTNISYFFVPNKLITSTDQETRLRSIFDRLFPRYS